MSAIATPALDKRREAATTEHEDGINRFVAWCEAQGWRICSEYGVSRTYWQPCNAQILQRVVEPFAGAVTSTEIGEWIDSLAGYDLVIGIYYPGNYEAIRARLEADPEQQKKRVWERLRPDDCDDYHPKGWFPVALAHSPQRLLEAFFGIDAEECERELTALLEAHRAINNGN